MDGNSSIIFLVIEIKHKKKKKKKKARISRTIIRCIHITIKQLHHARNRQQQQEGEHASNNSKRIRNITNMCKQSV